LQIPLFNGGIFQTQEKVARLRLSSSQADAKSVRQKVEAQVIKAYQAYRIALGQVNQQTESHELAGQLLDIQLMRFTNGQSTILDLRAAQSGYEDAAAGLVNAKFVAKIAETELFRLMTSLK
jgi:outer membrane protein TolC